MFARSRTHRKSVMRLRRGPLRLRAGEGRGSTGLGMAEVDLESDQIRLKCIRKEGFFTVPPEHRVRRGATHAAQCVAGPGRSALRLCGSPRRVKVAVPALAGTSVPELPRRVQKSAARRPGAGWDRGVRPRVRKVGCGGSPCVTHVLVLSLSCDAEGEPQGHRFLLQ